METLPQLVPLIILIPAVGAFINMFFGAKLSERAVSLIGTTAAALSFVVAVLLYVYLVNSGYSAAVVNPPLLDGWIRVEAQNVEIPWQMRVDTLSVTMMLVVTGVGTLIHVYAGGYMHGDARFYRFFAYLNMFLAFMLILVTGNNFLMLFVGWEGVGLCSFLLIGFWWDKAKGVGWKNSNAARKAFIVNRIGDFGLIMGVFLTFWTFGTLDFYRPGEVPTLHYAEHSAGETAAAGEAGEHSAGAAVVEGEAEAVEGESAVVAGEGEEAAVEGEGAVVAGEGEAAVEGEGEYGTELNPTVATADLGVFGQAERMLAEHHDVDFGPFTLPIESVLTLITLFMLVGAAGKSAQIPLFVWLPDAMAGPTPVSALIHAATMVTAGVYMMVRANVFYYNSELTSFIVTLIGVSTALVAGFIALGQWDIKRVLAYSTVSQLGFMVAAVGVGAYGAAMFHLMTHAFFKALLFLGSGSVIHGMEHGHHHAHDTAHGHGHDAHAVEAAHDAEAHASAHKADEEHDPHGDAHADDAFDPQDMRNMGGLATRMPITYITYLIGTLALAGIWPFAGFWSKDEIILDSLNAGLFEGGLHSLSGYIAFGVLLAAAGLTAFYMWRQIELVFHGEPRTDAANHAPESVGSMTLPLVVLAFFSLIGGFFNVPSNAALPTIGLNGILGEHRFTDWLEYSVAHAHAAAFNPIVAILALAIAVGAIFFARSIYGRGHALTREGLDPLQTGGTARAWSLANARLFWDETYYRFVERPFNQLSTFLADRLDWAFWHDYFHDTVIYKGFNGVGELLSKPVDQGVIDWIVNGVGRLVRWISSGLRQVQTGYVRTYAVSLLLGVVLVLLLLLLPLIQAALAAGN